LIFDSLIFDLPAGLLDVKEAPESAVVIAVQAGFVFFGGDEDFELVNFERVGLHGGVAAFVLLPFDALGQPGGLDVQEAVDAPLGVDEGMDEILLFRGVGLEAIEITLEEGVVFLLGLAGEDDRGGVHAVFDGVHGGAAFAGFGFGAAAATARGVGDGDCGGHGFRFQGTTGFEESRVIDGGKLLEARVLGNYEWMGTA
jgi:hypothetical protein